MKKLLALFWVAFFGVATLFAQGMSDAQVIEYVKNAQAAGKSQKEMTTELLRRGVTQEQALRIKKQYEKSNSVTEGTENVPTQLRKRSGIEIQQSYEAAEIQDQKTVIDVEKDTEDRDYVASNKIFGHDLFRRQNLSFEPSVNLATPALLTNISIFPYLSATFSTISLTFLLSRISTKYPSTSSKSSFNLSTVSCSLLE